jgi:hypothetical protein
VTDEIAEEIHRIPDSLAWPRLTLQELNNRLLETLPREELEDETSKTDEYSFDLRL